MKENRMCPSINAKRAIFEAVTVLNVPMLFTYGQIDPATLPKGVYQYSVRHHSEDTEKPIQICSWALANRYGSLLSTTPITLHQHPRLNNRIKDIDPDKDWERNGYSVKLSEYLEHYPIQKPRQKEYSR